jgi:hypothetical protein
MGVRFLTNLAIRPLDYVKIVEELEAKEDSATTEKKKEET